MKEVYQEGLYVDTTSTLYDLGQHTLEVSSKGSILIIEHATMDTPLKEIVQLDQEETYRLFVVLQAVFQ